MVLGPKSVPREEGGMKRIRWRDAGGRAWSRQSKGERLVSLEMLIFSKKLKKFFFNFKVFFFFQSFTLLKRDSGALESEQPKLGMKDIWAKGPVI